MAKDTGKSIAEEDLSEMDQGQVPIEKNGKTVWVDPGNLSAKQQAEVQNQANTPPEKALPQSVQAGENANQPPAAASPESAYQQLADAQANQYLGMIQASDPLTSGKQLGAIESTASQQAEQMLGASSTSPVSQWLTAQTQAAQAQNAPVAAAMAQTGAAADSAAGLEASGLQNMGSAENQMMQAAPYQQLLQSLAADVPYKLLSNYTMPQIESTVKTAEQGLGLSTSGAPTASAPSLPAPTLPAVNPGVLSSNALSTFAPPGSQTQ